ncbi:MAG TPA: NUDIX domain-containing protein [Thermomicrobiales bacterium]|nr:NUDIX domain-containing protein [Thermomicrobiales bacterium]
MNQASGLITVAAVCFLKDERLLTVRKRGSALFMLPGGKLEPGETAMRAAIRECREEIGAEVQPEDLTLLGTFQAPAANEVGWLVRSTTFVAETPVELRVAREIAEVRWIPMKDASATPLAPLLQHHVLPALDASLRGAR